MKISFKKIAFILVLIILTGCSITINNPDDENNNDTMLEFSEARVRYILADISLGGPLGYYESYTEDGNCIEAVNRWNNNVRVANISDFERVYTNGSIYIVYVGTTQVIDGMDVILTTDKRS